MKNKLRIAVAIAGIASFTACRGDHSANSGRDTASAQHNQPPTVDTAKVSTANGDNSGNGGIKAAADTAKEKPKK